MVLIGLSVIGCGHYYKMKRNNVQEKSPYPFFRGELNASGLSPSPSFTGKLDVIWEFGTNDKSAGPLTIYHGALVYPGTRNKIKFINLLDGSYLGHIKPGGLPQSGLVMSDSLGFFAIGPRKNKLMCINLLNKDYLWERKLRDAASGSIILNNRCIIGSAEGELFAFNLLTGDMEWSFKAKSKFDQPPAYDNGVIYQAGDDGTLYAVSADDGKEIFKTRLDAPLLASPAIAKLLYIGDMDGSVYGIDLHDGTTVWKNSVGGPVWTSIAVAPGHLFVGHSGGELVAVDPATGDIQWRYKAVDVIRASPLVVGDFVLFGTMGGDFYSLNIADGSLVESRKLKGAVFNAPVSDGERVYVATEKGMIICFGDSHASNNTGQKTSQLRP